MWMPTDMASNPQPQPDDPEQYRRFVEKARELESDESPEAFERVFKKIVPARRGRETQEPKS
jgi:hypothetical protein